MSATTGTTTTRDESRGGQPLELAAAGSAPAVGHRPGERGDARHDTRAEDDERDDTSHRERVAGSLDPERIDRDERHPLEMAGLEGRATAATRHRPPAPERHRHRVTTGGGPSERCSTHRRQQHQHGMLGRAVEPRHAVARREDARSSDDCGGRPVLARRFRPSTRATARKSHPMAGATRRRTRITPLTAKASSMATNRAAVDAGSALRWARAGWRGSRRSPMARRPPGHDDGAVAAISYIAPMHPAPGRPRARLHDAQSGAPMTWSTILLRGGEGSASERTTSPPMKGKRQRRTRPARHRARGGSERQASGRRAAMLGAGDAGRRPAARPLVRADRRPPRRGATSATRSRRAPSRRSTSSSTRSGSSRACGSSTSGAVPGVTPTSSPGGASPSRRRHQRAVRRAGPRRTRPPGRPSSGATHGR